MNKKLEKKKSTGDRNDTAGYQRFFASITEVLEFARHTAARTVNAVMTATYWEIGRRIIEFEQKGEKRAAYGEELLERLSTDLGTRFGRGFSRQNLQQMRLFYTSFPPETIRQTLSGEFEQPAKALKCQTVSDILQAEPEAVSLAAVAARFPLPWSAYVRLLSVKDEQARLFYETEALRGGWSVRQLNRQIDSQFYERTALSKNKAAMLARGQKQASGDRITPEEAIKDPYVLEFLQLKDEYSENDLEEALIKHLENFLLELGGEFCFVGRQKRLRIGDEWYRVDLIFFHRKLRCLVIVDLKLGKLTHADTGQMHLYLNYAAEHWAQPDENPPVGLILCAQKNEALAKYALHNLPNKVMATEYRTVLPDENLLVREIEETRKSLDARKARKKTGK